MTKSSNEISACKILSDSIVDEKKAVKDYMMLANLIDNESDRRKIIEIKNEEDLHRQELQNIFKRMKKCKSIVENGTIKQ